MPNIQTVRHPLLKHALTVLRERDTVTEKFVSHTAIVTQILIIEATKFIYLHQKQIETPLSTMTGYEIDKSLLFIPVLRAGVAMLETARQLYPWASVGFIGLERDEETAVAREYYKKFPDNVTDKHVFILDPMLATGGSLVDTITAAKAQKIHKMTVVCIVAAPEGIARLGERFPDIHVVTAAVDEKLDERKFIVPGLGDFGDRFFGT